MSQQKSSKSNTEDSGIPIIKNPNTDNAWKIVGSPSRRGSTVNVEKSPNGSPVTEHPEIVRRNSIASEVNWGSFGGFQWEGPSIFDEEGNNKSAGMISIPPNALPEDSIPSSVLSVPMLPGVSLEPIYRQHRSLSFSMGQDPTFFGYDDYEEPYQHVQFKSLLEPMAEEQEEDELDNLDLAFIRSRSKSSGAAFGLLPHTQRLPNRRDSEHLIEESQRRRSSRFFNTHELSLGDKEHLQRRRLSQNDYAFPSEHTPSAPNAFNSIHRQSLTLNTPPPTNIQQLADQLENTHILNYPHHPGSQFRPDLFTSFAPPKTPVVEQDKGVQDVGKGFPLGRIEGPLFMVEFKAGRSDFFYSPHFYPRVGELVIVEGDRGKDLGKVLANTLTLAQVTELEQIKQARLDSASSNEEQQQPKKETMIKRIFRLAAPDEIHAFMTKEQDEQKALAICQQRIKHRKLPMDIVDAEYQWDHRKLTFYFEAQHRIDFRELVRELFKIYKTRIWMCVVTVPVTLEDLSLNK